MKLKITIFRGVENYFNVFIFSMFQYSSIKMYNCKRRENIVILFYRKINLQNIVGNFVIFTNG